MTLRLESLPALGRVDAVDKRRKQQDHVPAFIHDGRPTEGALHLARQLVDLRLLRGAVPAKIVVPVREVDVLLVEDGSPLEGRAVEALAGGAVAVFRGQRAIAAQLVLYAAAVASALPLDLEVLLLVVDLVRRSVLPLITAAVCCRAALILMRLLRRMTSICILFAVGRHVQNIRNCASSDEAHKTRTEGCL